MRRTLSIFLALPLTLACRSGPAPEPEPRKNEGSPSAAAAPKAAATATATAVTTATAAPSMTAGGGGKPVANVPVAPGDPLNGKFTLEDATKGLAKEGKLTAELQTDKGTLECELYEDKAPITVANFVGLARGLRPYKWQGEWVKKPLYDGTPFHRIIKGFMVQGGDPNGNGSGGPGYDVPDEIWEGAHHDQRGLLCMANHGPNTNGSQFFIMDGAASHLDGGYTIFGKCTPDSVIEAIASHKVAGDHAIDPPKVKRVVVKRKK
jgi:peptidyl-prolyl cis-trans isomerase A (cyclophilin A)